MLTDEQVERYSRQIVLPEVGARGQERLLASRIALAGDGPAATIAALLLGRAGVGALEVEEHGSAADVAVMLAEGLPPPDGGVSGMLWSHEPGTPVVLGILGARLVVGTLLWRSCLGCFPDVWPLRAEELPAEAAPAARMALGALAANEALRVLLTAPTLSRLTLLDVVQGTAVVKEIEPVGCRLCTATA